MRVTTTISVYLLGFIVLSSVANSTTESILPSRVDSTSGEKIFLAPFTSTAFIEAAKIEAARLQIELERQIGVYLDKKTDLIWAANGTNHNSIRNDAR